MGARPHNGEGNTVGAWRGIPRPVDVVSHVINGGDVGSVGPADLLGVLP